MAMDGIVFLNSSMAKHHLRLLNITSLKEVLHIMRLNMKVMNTNFWHQTTTMAGMDSTQLEMVLILQVVIACTLKD